MFLKSKIFVVKFSNRTDFNLVTDWNLIDFGDPEIGYSDMIIQFESEDEKQSFLNCIIINGIKDFSEYLI